MSHDGICQLMCPEIEDRTIQDAPFWRLFIDPYRWGMLHILERHRDDIRVATFLLLIWPMELSMDIWPKIIKLYGE